MGNESHPTKFVSIMPTPEGYRQIARLFLQQIEQSQQKIKQAEEVQEWLENVHEDFQTYTMKQVVEILTTLLFTHRPLIDDALDAIRELEHTRIASLQSCFQQEEHPPPI